MNNRPTAAVALTLLLMTLLVTSVADAADKPARALLARAASEAQKWQKDAALVYVSTDSANADGTAPIWGYVFESPKMKKQIFIMIQAAGDVSSHESFTTYHHPSRRHVRGQQQDHDRGEEERTQGQQVRNEDVPRQANQRRMDGSGR